MVSVSPSKIHTDLIHCQLCSVWAIKEKLTMAQDDNFPGGFYSPRYKKPLVIHQVVNLLRPGGPFGIWCEFRVSGWMSVVSMILFLPMLIVVVLLRPVFINSRQSRRASFRLASMGGRWCIGRSFRFEQVVSSTCVEVAEVRLALSLDGRDVIYPAIDDIAC